jgi:hypothetical protein
VLVSEKHFYPNLTFESKAEESRAAPYLMEQVASNKEGLLLKIRKQKTQTLQLLTKIIKMESICNSN